MKESVVFVKMSALLLSWFVLVSIFGLGMADGEGQVSEGGPNRPPLLSSLMPKTNSSPTTLNQLGSKLIEAPIKLIDGVLTSSLNLGKTADNLVKASGDTTTKVVTSLASPKQPNRAPNINSDDYYEFSKSREPYEIRKPKYFSRECTFRFACELGKLTKPFTFGILRLTVSNRFIQDLQNRYTRAMTYGTLHEDCERYYCLLTSLLRGPAGVASGLAELANRVANPDMYEGVDISQSY